MVIIQSCCEKTKLRTKFFYAIFNDNQFKLSIVVKRRLFFLMILRMVNALFLINFILNIFFSIVVVF